MVALDIYWICTLSGNADHSCKTLWDQQGWKLIAPNTNLQWIQWESKATSVSRWECQGKREWLKKKGGLSCVWTLRRIKERKKSMYSFLQDLHLRSWLGRLLHVWITKQIISECRKNQWPEQRDGRSWILLTVNLPTFPTAATHKVSMTSYSIHRHVVKVP